MYLDTGAYLRTKETGGFTLLDYLTPALCHTAIAFIWILLPFPVGRSLLAWDSQEESPFGLHCAATHCNNSWMLLVWFLAVPLDLSPCLPHLQDFSALSGSFLQPGTSPSSFQPTCFFSNSSLLKSMSSLLSRLRAHSFPSLNGPGTEAQ